MGHRHLDADGAERTDRETARAVTRRWRPAGRGMQNENIAHRTVAGVGTPTRAKLDDAAGEPAHLERPSAIRS